MIDHILAPLDGSSLAECVLPHAAALAQAFGARVTVLQVAQHGTGTDMVPAVDPLDWQLRRAESEAYLEEIIARLQELGLDTQKVVLEGQPAERIIEFAREQDVGLIVLSSHGRGGLSEWNISSVVQKVILRAYRPTLIVRAYHPFTGQTGELRYERIMVPLDGSQRSECALPLATALARSHEAELLLAHVVTRPDVPRHTPLTREEAALVDQLVERNREEAERYLDELRPQLQGKVEVRLLVRDNTSAALHELIEMENVDIVVMSAHGYSGEAQWPYGNVALNIIVYGSRPLLIIQDISEQEIKRSAVQQAIKERKGH